MISRGEGRMSVIDEYLKTVKPEFREELNHIRNYIQTLVPDAEETISYAIPTFKYKGKNLIHFAGFKDHMSIFPTSQPVAALQEQLKDFTVLKGTIQFTMDHRLPDESIKQLVEIRLQEIDSKI